MVKADQLDYVFLDEWARSLDLYCLLEKALAQAKTPSNNNSKFISRIMTNVIQ